MPNGIAVSDDARVYIADNWHKRLQVFTTDGKRLGQWPGGCGEGKGKFHSLDGLAVDSLGNVFVADSNLHRVQKFTSSGQFISRIGAFGTDPGQLNGSPSGHYQAVYSGFTSPGQYLVTVFAADTEGNVSQPKPLLAAGMPGRRPKMPEIFPVVLRGTLPRMPMWWVNQKGKPPSDLLFPEK